MPYFLLLSLLLRQFLIWWIVVSNSRWWVLKLADTQNEWIWEQVPPSSWLPGFCLYPIIARVDIPLSPSLLLFHPHQNGSFLPLLSGLSIPFPILTYISSISSISRLWRVAVWASYSSARCPFWFCVVHLLLPLYPFPLSPIPIPIAILSSSLHSPKCAISVGFDSFNPSQVLFATPRFSSFH